jgi:hypothetical protein
MKKYIREMQLFWISEISTFLNVCHSGIIMVLLKQKMEVSRKCCFMNPNSCMQYVMLITSVVTPNAKGTDHRQSCPTDQQFLIQITSAPPKAKIATGPARLHVQDQRFCITSGVPPRLINFWEIGLLRWVPVTCRKFPQGALEYMEHAMSKTFLRVHHYQMVI